MSEFIKLHSRRAFLQAAIATCLTSCGKQIAELEPVEPIDHFWSGIGFGIGMSAELYQVKPGLVEKLDFESLIVELEARFSLYSISSELSVLNREKVLRNPSTLFLELLDLAESLSLRTNGYYQPAIHAAWSAMERGELTAELLEASNMENVQVEEGEVRLINPLTELSFNAIVQGYLTDRVADYCRTLGVSSALLHFGESYGIGLHPEGRMWSLAVMGSPVDGETDLVGIMDFANAGLAVSTHDSTRKLLNPKLGEAQMGNRVVAVVSEEGAAVADAFATAFTVAPESQWAEFYQNLVTSKIGAVKIWQENVLVFER